MTDFRHEWKHEINLSDKLALQHRLRAVAKLDSHARNGIYQIRSLYFDNAVDRALRQKLDGVDQREKFRIRLYNHDVSLIRLEKKSKLNGLGQKISAILTAEQAQSIVDGRLSGLFWMQRTNQPLIQELYYKMRTQGLQPKTIVDYTREAYLFGPGNVRVTLDDNIRTGLRCVDFLNPDCVTIPALSEPSRNASIVLEVKWDNFLPEIIRDAVQLEGRHTGAFSKYAACRIYG